MIWQRLQKAWNHFFFTPQSPVPISSFRIIFGVCVCCTVILLHADWLDWFGVHSWVSLSTMTTIEPGVRLNLFTVMPQDDRWVAAFFWVFLSFALLLTVGLWTRVSSVAVFLCLNSIQQRNLFMTHGGDTFLRVAGFFLIFAPAGAGPLARPSDPSAQRLGRHRDFAESSVGSTDDPVRVVIAVLHLFLVEDEGQYVA